MKGRHRQEMTPSESLRQMAEELRGVAKVYAAAFTALAAAIRTQEQKRNDTEASSGDRRRTENEQ